MDWTPLEHSEQLVALRACDGQYRVVFKHSTRCDLSALVQQRLEKDWSLSADRCSAYWLDVIKFPTLSAQIATEFAEFHASPQLLLFWGGEVSYAADGLDVSFAEMCEHLIH